MKKLLCIYLLILTALLSFSACNGNKNSTENEGQNNKEPSTHVHNFGDWDVNKAPTCTEDGTKVRYCSCGEKQMEVIVAYGHIPSDEIVEDVVPSTCYSNGTYNIVVLCLNCEIELERTTHTSDRLSHTPADAVEENRTNPTFDKDGSYQMVVYCSIPECHQELERTTYALDMLTHHPGSVVIENEIQATCISHGSYDEVVYCIDEDCGHKELSRKTVTTEMVSHTPGNSVVENTVPAGCTVDGSYEEVVYCIVENCKIQISRTTKVLEAIGYHTYFKLVCTECGANKPASQGLEFTYRDECFYDAPNPDGCAWYGIGLCTDKNIVIPSHVSDTIPVVSIGCYDGKEFGSIGVESIEIPYTIKYFDSNVLSRTISLTEIIVSEDNPYFTSIDGVLYNKDVTELIFYPAGRKAESFVIPDTVTKIAKEAFSYTVHLSSITIPESVVEINNYAFGHTYKLVEIVNNSSLNIQKGQTTDSRLTEYAMEVHSGSSRLINIDDFIFYSYNGVNYLVGYVGDETFIDLPENYNGEFYAINQYAFSNYYYNDPSNIKSITIPSGVIDIGDHAFEGCDMLVEVVNNSSLNIVKGSTDKGSIALSAIEVHKGNSKIFKIDDYVFYKMAETNYLIGYEGDDIDLVLPATCYGEQYAIYRNAFRWCDVSKKIKSVVIPSSVSSIGSSAFYQCSSLQKVVLTDSIKTIGDYAFYWCTSLTSIDIPESVTSIGKDAFWGCNRIVEVVNNSSLEITPGSSSNGWVAYYALEVCTGTSKFDIIDDFVFYTVDGINYLVSYEGDNTNIVLPDSYNGEDYKIRNYAFYGCIYLEGVVIPDSVTSIGNGAFFMCTSLESIVIPNSVTSIGHDAFYGCTSLQNVTLPVGLTSIGDDVFCGCTSLESIVIPDGVTSIGNYAFGDCTSLESIVIPDGVTSIGYSAFKGCISLQNVTLPVGLTSIEEYAFYRCTSLKTIVIPDGVTSIGHDAFYGCTSLESIVIPDSLISIWDAFDNCEHIKHVYYTGTEEKFKEIGGVSSFAGATIHYI